MPLPSDETTPPVMNTYLVSSRPPRHSPSRHPSRFGMVAGAAATPPAAGCSACTPREIRSGQAVVHRQELAQGGDLDRAGDDPGSPAGRADRADARHARAAGTSAAASRPRRRPSSRSSSDRPARRRRSSRWRRGWRRSSRGRARRATSSRHRKAPRIGVARCRSPRPGSVAPSGCSSLTGALPAGRRRLIASARASGSPTSAPSIRTSSSITPSPDSSSIRVSLGSPAVLTTRKWRSASAAICGRCVMQSSWVCSESRSSFSPSARAVRPPTPASTSSNTSVGRAERSRAASRTASAMRDSSPPDAVRAIGVAASPGFACRKQLDAVGAARARLALRRGGPRACACSIPRSARCASTARANGPGQRRAGGRAAPRRRRCSSAFAASTRPQPRLRLVGRSTRLEQRRAPPRRASRARPRRSARRADGPSRRAGASRAST